MNVNNLLIATFVAINLVAFIMMASDKRRSIKGGNTDRTPEGLIFYMAAAFGAIGVYAGMLLLGHKTRKWYFQLGIPLLILQNLAALYLIVDFIT